MIKTKNNLFLAPLDNVNCIAFRLLCKENGAGLVSTEMIDTEAFIRKPELFKWYKEERPLLVQFIGNKPKKFKLCVENVSDCDVVDLNAGCPSDDQNQRMCGAAILQDLKLFEKIIKTMVKYSHCDVSVKIRMGYEKNEALKICKIIEKSGADFLTIHPRTKFQGYGTPADWNVIKKVKQKIKIPVYASGDLTSAENIKKCFDQTNCDGVMVARGAINDPFIFNDTLNYMKTGNVVEHSSKERFGLLTRFIELYHKYDKFSLAELRNHCAWLVKSVKHATKIRDAIGKSKTEEEIVNIINKYK